MIPRLIRPLWVVGLTWLCTCLVGVWLLPWLWPVAAGIGVLGAVILLAVPAWRQRGAAWLALVTVVAASALLTYWETERYQPLQQWVGKEVTLCMRVCDAQYRREVEVISGDLPAGTRLWLWSEPDGLALKAYDVVETTVIVESLSGTGLQLHQSKASGVWAAARVVNYDETGWKVTAGTPPVWACLTEWRRAAVARIRALVSGDAGVVITGIAFGADTDLSAQADEAFAACGVTHIFSVSGMHLAVVTQVLLALLKRCRIPRLPRALLCMAAVCLFCALVGFEPAVTRSAVMCLLVVGGSCLRRQADARTSLGLALILLLVDNPFAAYDVGLLLSFTATFGLLFLAPVIRQWLLRVPLSGVWSRVWEYVATAIAVSLAATVATLPIMVVFFGYVSVMSIPANLLMSLPADGVLLAGLAAALAFVPNAEILYRPLLWIAGVLSRFMLWCGEWLASFPLAVISFNDPYVTAGIFAACAVVAANWRLFHSRWAVMVTAALCAVVVLAGTAWYEAALRDVVRIRDLSTETDLAVYVCYHGETVLITAPTKADTLYDIRSALHDDGIAAVDTVWLPENRTTAEEQFSTVLAEPLAEATVRRMSQSVTEYGTMFTLDGWLYWQVDNVRLAFDLSGGDGNLYGVNDAVFSVAKGRAYGGRGGGPIIWNDATGYLCMK